MYVRGIFKIYGMYLPPSEKRALPRSMNFLQD